MFCIVAAGSAQGLCAKGKGIAASVDLAREDARYQPDMHPLEQRSGCSGHIIDVGGHHPDQIRSGLRKGTVACRQILRRIKGIGIHDADKFGSDLRHAEFERVQLPGRCLGQIDGVDIRNLIHDPARNLRRGIFGRIVNQIEIKPAQALRRQRFERVGQKLCLVIIGQHDRPAVGRPAIGHLLRHRPAPRQNVVICAGVRQRPGPSRSPGACRNRHIHPIVRQNGFCRPACLPVRDRP